jgi:hypothetical protein
VTGAADSAVPITAKIAESAAVLKTCNATRVAAVCALEEERFSPERLSANSPTGIPGFGAIFVPR